MITINPIEMSVMNGSGRRVDVSFINEFEWKSPDHMKEAIQVLLASRLAESAADEQKTPARMRSATLDEGEMEQIRMRLASNPNTPPVVLAYLAKSASAKVLERIAENPQAPPQMLRALACMPNADVRAAVSENANTPRDVLDTLMADPDADVRYRLAENPFLPMELLTRLCAEDQCPYVAARASQTLAKLSCGVVYRADFGSGTRSRRGDVAAIR